MSREVCGTCWCPYDEDTGKCACPPPVVRDDTALLRQIYKTMGLIGADLVCEAAHHEKKDRHAIGDPCPIQKRWHEIFAALRERLGEK